MEPIDEKAPEKRLGMVLGGQGEHDEADDVVVCGDHPQPGDDRGPIDHLRDQGIGEGLQHRGDELLLGPMRPQGEDIGDVFGSDLD
jgi:hypothetical protein